MPNIDKLLRGGALAVAAACLLAGPMPAAGDGGSARDLVEQVTTSILDELTAKGDVIRDDPRQLYEIVDRLALPHFDFERMSRGILGKRRWKESSEDQRTRFVSAFRTTLVRTYASVLKEYRGHTLAYLDPVARKKENEVVIPVDIGLKGGQRFRVSYAMYRDGSDWKVFDIALDGVSLVTNYRSSFRAEIARSGLDELIARLEAKNTATN